jgi:hypothetical protein
MASNALPPIVQRIVVENPQAIPQAMQAAAASVTAATAPTVAYAQSLQAVSAAQDQVAATSTAAATGVQKVAYSATEARVAAMGLGVEFGVRMPRALTRFLSQSETIGPILAKAFSAVALFAVVEILMRLPDMIKNGADAIMGLDDNLKKTYDDVVKGSRDAEEAARKLNKELREAATIGLGGVAKSAAGSKNAAADHKDLADAYLVEAAKLHVLNAELARVPKAMDYVKDPILVYSGRTQSDIEKSIAEQADLTAKAQAKRDASVVEGVKAAKELGVAQREQVLAEIEILHTRDNARIAGEEQAVRASRQAGEITLQEEEKRLIDLEHLKLASEERLLEAKAARSGGGIGEGQLTGQKEAAEQESANRISTIRAQTAAKLKSIDDAQEKALIDVDKSTGAAQIQQAENTAKHLAEVHRTTAEQERTTLLVLANDEFNNKAAAINKEIAIAEEKGEEGKAEATKLNGDLITLNTELGIKRAQINADTDRKIQEQTLKAIDEQVSAQEHLGAEQLRIAEESASNRLKLDEIMLPKWQRLETEAIQKWEIGQLAAVKRAEAALEAEHLKESEEYKRLQDREVLIKQQAAQKQMQIDQQVAMHWHQVQTSILNDFNRTLIQIQKGQVTWGKGFVQLFDSLLLEAEQYFLKLAEQNALHWAIQKIQDITGWGVKGAVDASGAAAVAAAEKAIAMATVTTDAGVAAAGTMAYYSPFAPEIAPEMAAIQFALTMAYGTFAKGGVVPNDMVAKVHKGEGVFSRPVMDMINRTTNNTSNTGATNVRNSMTYHNHTGGSGEMTPAQMMKNLTKQMRRQNLSIGNLRS